MLAITLMLLDCVADLTVAELHRKWSITFQSEDHSFASLKSLSDEAKKIKKRKMFHPILCSAIRRRKLISEKMARQTVTITPYVKNHFQRHPPLRAKHNALKTAHSVSVCDVTLQGTHSSRDVDAGDGSRGGLAGGRRLGTKQRMYYSGEQL